MPVLKPFSPSGFPCNSLHSFLLLSRRYWLPFFFAKGILVLLLFLPLAAAGQQESPPVSPEAYLEYIKAENAATRDHLEKMNNAIQEERQAHYEFVEGVYRWTAIGVGILASVFGGLIVFIGWQSGRQVRNDLNKLMQTAIQEPALLNKLLSIVSEEMNLEKGSFAFVADETLHEGLQKEIKLLGNRGIHATLKKPGEPVQNVDVVLYRFLPEDRDNGVDHHLDSLLNDFIHQGLVVPIVVYSPDKLWIKGSTLERLEQYQWQHMANNMISLVDNAASAYRVSRLKGDR